MPKIIGPLEDEIDISTQEVEGQEAQTELPDEIEVEDAGSQEEETETPEGEEPNTEVQPEEQETEGAASEKEEEKPNSSLTSEPETPTSEEQSPVTEELSDERVMAYLSEKLGREVNSFEYLTPQEATEVEDPFKGDEQLKELAEWRERTGRPISDWAKYQKDYNSLDNESVVREYLQHKYPDFTPDEIALEMEEYLVNEDTDLENDIARKNLKLKKMAITAREELNQYRSTFNEPVERPATLSKEQQEAISFYEKYQKQTAKAQEQAEAYTAGIQTEASNVQSIPLQLDDETSIELKLSDSDRRSLPDLVTKMPHWYNEDGTYNHSAIVKDAAKIANFDKAVKLAFEQGVSKGIEKEDKSSRNVDFSGARKGMPSHNDEIVIEGADSFGRSGLKFGSRR